MREIGLKEIEDIALGAVLLGAGGGGDPYIGKLMAMGAIRECGPVKMLEPDEIPDDALILPIAMMGAPTVLVEKAINGKEYEELYRTMSQFYGKEIFAFMPLEAGGVNSMLPFVAAARLGLPIIDADSMGRAFPQLDMTTFTLGDIKASPMALTDEKGNSIIFKAISNKWAEELARSVTMSCGGAVSVALYCLTGAQLKKYGIKNIITRSEMLGKAISSLNEKEGDMENSFLQASEAYKLFKGKITDLKRDVRGGFNFGTVILDGIGECKGQNASVDFQNENLIAKVDGEIRATTPDLICLLDPETFIPIPTDALKYGKRVLVVGLKCDESWRTKDGLNLVGPRCFGYETDYIPIEQRYKEGI